MHIVGPVDKSTNLAVNFFPPLDRSWFQYHRENLWVEDRVKLIVVVIIPDGTVIDPAGSKRGRYVVENVVKAVLNTSEHEIVWIVTVER